MKSVIIIGGGLSGLITGIRLVRSGIPCTIIEKRSFPMHRVCGEYISNETVPYLKSHELYPSEFNPQVIRRLRLTSVNGRSAHLPLDIGGFGISRYAYDNFLFQKAEAEGVLFYLHTEVDKAFFEDGAFNVETKDKSFSCDIVVGSFGKRSKVDVTLGRRFIQKRSPYIGVKYHIRTDHPNDLIALHNFKDGYCGISNIEDGKSNLCYLSHRDNLRHHGNIRKMEEAVLFRNPFLRSIFENSEFILDKPETINEISFETKSPVEEHILMTGDAAGMITPLCGNGMAMAIHSSKILSDLLIPFCRALNPDRSDLEKLYTRQWEKEFKRRLWAGRQIQRLFGSEWTSDLAIDMARHAKPLAHFLINSTHGAPF